LWFFYINSIKNIFCKNLRTLVPLQLIILKMTKEQIIQTFDPSQPGLADATIFGLPFSSEQSEIIIIPVPWEVTVSYGAGASEGPEAVLDASFQVDLNHQDFPELWKLGMY
jgi:agmatinase